MLNAGWPALLATHSFLTINLTIFDILSVLQTLVRAAACRNAHPT
jgi:hypothetical protein